MTTTINAGDVVSAAQGEQGWSDEETLSVLMDFVNSTRNVNTLTRYLRERVRRESLGD